MNTTCILDFSTRSDLERVVEPLANYISRDRQAEHGVVLGTRRALPTGRRHQRSRTSPLPQLCGEPLTA